MNGYRMIVRMTAFFVEILKIRNKVVLLTYINATIEDESIEII